MPSQQQVEFYRKKYQQFTPFKLQNSVLIALVTNVATAPLELLKVRAQLLQEGRKLHGFGLERGSPMVRNYEAVIESGAGLRGLFTGYDTLVARALWYGTFRCFFYCHLFNYVNKDPRRTPHWWIDSATSFAAGFIAGVVTNPIDIVYNRQVADALYPIQIKRNYTSFLDGLMKANSERALMRGAVASGVSYGVLLGSMSNFYDFAKEYCYWFFGPTEWLRPMVLIPTAVLGVTLYLPFDNLKVRYHTMTPLPNGEMPYKGYLDTALKVFNYECSIKGHSGILALTTGAAPAFIKLYASLFAGIKITDYAFQQNYKEGEFFEPSTVYSAPSLGIISHEPYQNIALNHDVMANVGRYDRSVELGFASHSHLKY